MDKKLMLIAEVTQDDIKNGFRVNGSLCPVALAVQRLFPFGSVLVYAGQAHITTASRTVHFKLSKRTVRFYHAFDDNGNVKPFKFVLGV